MTPLEVMLHRTLRQSLPPMPQEQPYNPFQDSPVAPALNMGADMGQAIQQGGFNILQKLGQITGLDGSSLWAPGLDVDLRKGDPVPNAMSGVVDFVGPRGGFGKQVRVKGDDGREYWYSHLDTPQAKVGQRLSPGEILGLGGNTGNVIPGLGGDGSHLDLTVRENGQYMKARAVAELLRSFNTPEGSKSMFSSLLQNPLS